MHAVSMRSKTCVLVGHKGEVNLHLGLGWSMKGFVCVGIKKTTIDNTFVQATTSSWIFYFPSKVCFPPPHPISAVGEHFRDSMPQVAWGTPVFLIYSKREQKTFRIVPDLEVLLNTDWKIATAWHWIAYSCVTYP